MNEIERVKNGEFVRTTAGFRNWITCNGSLGPTGVGGFNAEPGRYNLYVSYACPWTNRTLIFRKLKGLEDVVSVSIVHSLLELFLMSTALWDVQSQKSKWKY